MRQAFESYTASCEATSKHNEKEFKELYNVYERALDHQTAVLNDIKEELEMIELLMSQKRLNKEKLSKVINEICHIVINEL